MNESRRERIATLMLTAQVQRDGIHALDNVRKCYEEHAQAFGISAEEGAEFFTWLHEEMLKGVRSRHIVDAFSEDLPESS